MKLSITANKKLLLLTTCFLWLSACTLIKSNTGPSIKINKVPPSDTGGSTKFGDIAGTVTQARPGQKIVLYARSGVWWIQPFVKNPFTEIQSDSTWKNSIHLGTEYAAILVESGYVPKPKVNELPALGNGVIAISTAQGMADTSGTPTAAAPKTIRFSGYEWTVHNRISSPGDTVNIFDPENVWTDENGYLHLRIANKDGKWTAAEISLTRSLGYGTYQIVVQDVTRMDPAAVFSMCTWDNDEESHHRQMNLDISHWGDPDNKNLQYVIHPYYIPANTAKFNVSAGVTTHALRWEPGRAAFKSVQVTKASTLTVAEQDFMSGIPTPKAEKVHLSLHIFDHGKTHLQKETEVVIEKFEYLP